MVWLSKRPGDVCGTTGQGRHAVERGAGFSEAKKSNPKCSMYGWFWRLPGARLDHRGVAPTTLPLLSMGNLSRTPWTQVEVGKDYYCADKSSNTHSDLFLQATQCLSRLRMDITERSLVTFVVEGRTFWCWQPGRQCQLHGANMNRESREGCHSAKGPGLHDFDIFFWSTKMATANFNKMEELWVEIDSRSSFLKAYVGSSHHPVTVSTSIIAFLVGSLYKPSFDTVTAQGVDPI